MSDTKNPQKKFLVTFSHRGGCKDLYIELSSTTRDGARKKFITKFRDQDCCVLKVEER